VVVAAGTCLSSRCPETVVVYRVTATGLYAIILCPGFSLVKKKVVSVGIRRVGLEIETDLSLLTYSSGASVTAMQEFGM
jgi:hypothetical protein